MSCVHGTGVTFQPALKRRQQLQQPDYIQQKAREKLAGDGVVVAEPPDAKRRRSQGEVPPLDTASTTSGVAKLPELPVDLKRKQVRAGADD